jgi:hypothetical protein
MSLAEQHVEGVLREVDGDRVVLAARLASGQRCTTRVLLAPVDAHLDRLVRAVILSGRGSPVGLPASVTEIIEAYRIRLRLGDMEGLPAVLAAGVSDDPPAAVKARPAPGTGWVYVTTAWIEGRPLDAAWASSDEPTRRRLATGVAQRLANLHRERVCFGDLKPSNVIVHGEQVSLIDLDTLREVPERELGVRTTAATQEYAAPEQIARRETFLASDIWALGETLARLVTGEPASPARLTAAGPFWGPLIARCQAVTPGARPTADELVALLTNDVRLPDREVTARIADPALIPKFVPAAAAAEAPAPPTPPVPGGEITRPVAPAPTLIEETSPSADEAWPTIPARPGPPMRRSPWVWIVAAVVVLLLVIAMGAYALHLRTRLESCERVEAQRAALKAQKTIQAQNKDPAVLTAIVQNTEAELPICDSPEARGLYALARVWAAGWQMKKKTYNRDDFEAVRPLVEAVRGSDVPEAIAARVGFDGAQCRLLPKEDEAGRLAACERVHRAADTALQTLPAASWGWLRVEIAWADAMAGLGEAQRFHPKQPPQAQQAATAALDSCVSALSDLPEAPVNGIEMLETCMRIAGHARDLNAHASFAAQAAPVALGSEAKAKQARLSEIYTSIAPECDATKAGKDLLPTPRPGDGGWADWCAVAGARAIGCGDRVQPPVRVVNCACTNIFTGEAGTTPVTDQGYCPHHPYWRCQLGAPELVQQAGVPWSSLIPGGSPCPL